MQLSPTARAFFERVAGGERDRRKIALVATARWLACVMLSMLRSGEVWRERASNEEAVRGEEAA